MEEKRLAFLVCRPSRLRRAGFAIHHSLFTLRHSGSSRRLASFLAPRSLGHAPFQHPALVSQWPAPTGRPNIVAQSEAALTSCSSLRHPRGAPRKRVDKSKVQGPRSEDGTVALTLHRSTLNLRPSTHLASQSLLATSHLFERGFVFLGISNLKDFLALFWLCFPGASQF